jgi:hypothetical protein
MNLKGVRTGGRGRCPYCLIRNRTALGNRCSICAGRLEDFGSTTAPRVKLASVVPYRKAARSLLWKTHKDIDTLCVLSEMRQLLERIPRELRVPQRACGRWFTAKQQAQCILYHIDRQRLSSPDKKARDAARILVAVVAGALAYPLESDDPRYRRNLVGRCVGHLLMSDTSALYGRTIRTKIRTKGSSRRLLALADALIPIVKWWVNAERKKQIQAIVDVHRANTEPRQRLCRAYSVV